MSVASTIKSTDNLMIVQDGVNKVSTISNLLKNLNSNDNIRINPAQLAVDFSVASKNDANALHLNSSTDKVGIGTSSPQSKFHVNGNAQIGSDVSDGVLVQSTETLTYTSSDQTNGSTKIVSPLRAGTLIVCNTGVNGLFSMSAGANGQLKSIILNTIDVGKTATITLVGAGFNTITLDTVGKSILLQYFSSTSKWYVVGGNGYMTSTI